jgi:hypothetical protein
LAGLLATRDDLGDGLTGGRYALAINHTGLMLMEQPIDLTAGGV